jgi:hypothetical protein
MKPTEVQIGEHWDQFCIRHMEGILEEAGQEDKWINVSWEEIPEPVKTTIRALVVERWQEWRRIEKGLTDTQ